ncbi:hypothetical protein AT727_24045 [Desulfitobacterium hafniense]|uniref:Probable membrane transporter protein n=1 Tax=Desulfitobacterium hafniense TaxID=49338 RepID=A0A0W1JGM4_DESHA|nr:sulfite exporter TauE/SafE family protein [Desulfitobacterium hafniense]KTE90739.1 hypothetical protein AT727_24045 [Desulfitobacterium hafniense]
MNLIILTIILGFIGSFISGLVGIGGAIIMIPLLRFLPPAIGLEELSMQTIAGITIVQVMVATGTAALVHKSNNSVKKDLVIWLGVSIVIGSFLGGLGSKYVPEATLEFIFAVLALIAAVMMFVPQKETTIDQEFSFNKILGIISSFFVGIFSGLVGAGGSFLLVPIMLYILKIPLRTTIGSSLGIVFLSSISGFVSKTISGQIVWVLALAIILGAIPGANFGSKVSKYVSNFYIKLLLALLISASAIKMWIDILII